MEQPENELNGYKYSFNRVNPYIQSQSRTQNSQLNSDFHINKERTLSKNKLSQMKISKTARQFQSNLKKQYFKKQVKFKSLKNQQMQLIDIYVRKFKKKPLSQSLNYPKNNQVKIKNFNSPQEDNQSSKKQIKRQIKVKPMSSLTQFWLQHPYLSKNTRNSKKVQIKSKNKTSSIQVQTFGQNLYQSHKHKKQLLIKTQNDLQNNQLGMRGKKISDFNKTSKNSVRKLFGAEDYFTPKSKLMNKNVVNNTGFFRSNGKQKLMKMFTQIQQRQIIRQFYQKGQ